MSAAERHPVQPVRTHADTAVGLLLRAHGLSKTLELALVAAEGRHEQMRDSVQFSSFVTSIEQVNDAVHEAINAALDEINRIQLKISTGGVA